jgi:hypothetical protein
MDLNTWDDLATLISKMTPEQRLQPVQIINSHPCEDHVHELRPGILFCTIGEMQLKYCRSSVDNRHHDDEFAIYTDSNPFAESGATAYELGDGGSLTPIFPKSHDDSADWTGPAQKIVDYESSEWIPFNGVATVEGEIVHLVPNDAPEQKLWSVAADVRIEVDSVKVRIGGFVHGGTCGINNSNNELKPCDLAVVKARLKNLDQEALND